MTQYAHGLREWPGYTGMFTRNEAPGAMPNGTRVAKTRSEHGDSHPDGSLGTVLGSFREPAVYPDTFYFVEWDAGRGFAVGTLALKLRRA